MEDVNKDGAPADAGTDGKPGGDPNQEPSPGAGEGQYVPYHRFQEVNDRLGELKEQIAALEQKKQEDNISPSEQKELEAKQYLEKMTRDVIEKMDKERVSKEGDELKQFDKEVGEALEAHKDIKRDDFLKFLEESGDDYASVASAMKGYKRLESAKEDGKKDAKLDIAGKPGLPRSEAAAGGGTQAEDKGKSIFQLAEEAKARLK